MSTEPVTTSLCYDPLAPYTAPVGRLPVLGKVRAEIDQIRAAIASDKAKTINDTTRATNEVNKTVGELQELVNKTAAEVGLLDQKKQTELAQVSDTVSTGSVAGIVGKQKTLFQKQAAGFDRDAEQKLAKIMVDAWSVTATVAGEANPATAGLDNPSIAAVMTLAKAGITPPA